MLQVSAEATQGGRKNRPSAAHATLDKTDESYHFHPGIFDELTSNEPTNPHDSTELHCLHHYKAGTDFCKSAASGIDNYTKDSGVKLPMLLLDEGRMEFVQYGLPDRHNLMKTPTRACFMNFMRNPFDLVVSSYLFSMSVPHWESYLSKTFGRSVKEDLNGCEPVMGGGRMSDWCNEKPVHFGMSLFHQALAKIFFNSSSGPLADELPDAEAEELYPQYLRRVDTDAGLLASSVFVNDVALEPMRWSKDYVHQNAKAKECSANVCFAELYNDCRGMWERVLTAWGIGDKDYKPMIEAVMAACPSQNTWAEQHSSAYEAKRHNIGHPPLHELVQRLRKLDRIHLNGKLALLEQHLGCTSSGKYLQPEV